MTATATMTGPLLSAALNYAGRGWPVFPLHDVAGGQCSCEGRKPDCTPGKHPRTPHGFLDASTDENVIRAWWRRWPNANIGIATGPAPASGLLMIGPDGDQGKADLAALEAQHGPLPETITAASGSGGEHRLFWYPDSGKVPCRENHRDTKIDIRGWGGYFVAAPSVNGKGPYRWVIDPDETSIATPPDWLIDWARKDDETERKKKTNHTRTDDDDHPTEDKVASALKHVPASDKYDPWVETGMALHDWDSLRGFGLWCDWSSTSGKYTEEVCRKKWESFTAGGGLTIATIFRKALDNGWHYGPKIKTGSGQTGSNGKPDAGKADTSGAGTDKEGQKTDNPLITDALDNTEFNAAELKHEWYIENLLVKNEPAVLAAASKTMKTALTVDAAISLASATPFLGSFPVREPVPVYIISAESGAASLQARMRQVCKAKGIDPNGLPIHWYTRIESLATPEGCKNLEDALRHYKTKVVILDPSYLLLGGPITTDNAGNMFAMGSLLANVGAACQTTGATPIVVTHANGRVPVGKSMEIEHIAWSGFQQWMRQWWLISRIEEYRDNGRHALYFRFGGSAGHTGLYIVGIDEGVFDGTGTGKKWEVHAIDARESQKKEQQEQQAEEQRELERNAQTVLAAMVSIIDEVTTVATRNALQNETGLKRVGVDAAVQKLIGDGAVIEATGRIRCGPGHKGANGIRRPDSWSE